MVNNLQMCNVYQGPLYCADQLYQSMGISLYIGQFLMYHIVMNDCRVPITPSSMDHSLLMFACIVV